MAKGAESKSKAMEIILNTFPGSFMYDKEIRIPYVEDGENIQLKCVLTCAKVNVNEGGDAEVPGEKSEVTTEVLKATPAATKTFTQEEKENIQRLMSSLGL